MITLSGNINEIGTITNCNNGIKELLNYQEQDLLGQNINSIIPTVYRQIHESLISNYLVEKDGKIGNRNILVLPLDKDNFIVPCKLLVKVLPNLEKGIQLVGFLSKLKKVKSFNKDFVIKSDVEFDKVGVILFDAESY